MAYEIQGPSPDKQIEDSLGQLFSKFGTDNVLAVLQGLGFQRSENGTADEPVQKNLTIAKAFHKFATSGEFLALSKLTRRTYRYEIKCCVNYCKKVYPDWVHTPIEQFIGKASLAMYLSTVKCVNTRNKKSSFLRKFIEVIKGSETKVGYKSVLKIESDPNEEPKAFTHEQLNEILLRAKRTRNGMRNHAIVRLFVGSGIRLDELTQLRYRDLNSESKTIMVFPKRSKEKQKRRFVLDESFQVLKHYLIFEFDDLSHVPPETFIFRSEHEDDDGNPKCLSNRSVEDMIRKLIDKCESIPASERHKYTVHSFRHTFAMRLLEGGVDIYTIAKLLGHKNLKTVEVYLKLFDDEVRRGIEKMPLGQNDTIFLRNLREAE